MGLSERIQAGDDPKASPLGGDPVTRAGTISALTSGPLVATHALADRTTRLISVREFAATASVAAIESTYPNDPMTAKPTDRPTALWLRDGQTATETGSRVVYLGQKMTMLLVNHPALTKFAEGGIEANIVRLSTNSGPTADADLTMVGMLGLAVGQSLINAMKSTALDHSRTLAGIGFAHDGTAPSFVTYCFAQAAACFGFKPTLFTDYLEHVSKQAGVRENLETCLPRTNFPGSVAAVVRFVSGNADRTRFFEPDERQRIATKQTEANARLLELSRETPLELKE